MNAKKTPDIPIAQILITGGAGFLGAHLVRAFLDAGKTVRVLDVASPPAWAKQVDYVQSGVCDVDAVSRAVRGVESVIHAAFASPVAAYLAHGECGWHTFIV